MAMKKDIKAWAIKLRGRSFYLDEWGRAQLFRTQLVAQAIAHTIRNRENVLAAPIRVRVRIEEIE